MERGFCGITLALLLVAPLVLTTSTKLNKIGCSQNHSSKVWLPFEEVGSSRPPLVEVLDSDERTCVITARTYGIYKEQVEVEGKAFYKLMIPDNGFMNDVGRPQLPAIRGLVEIPSGKNVNVTARSIRSVEISGYTVYPTQAPTRAVHEKDKRSAFQLDQELYSIDAYYPNTLVSVSPPAQLRDHVVVQLSVYPLQFNPAANRLKISIEVQIKLEYNNLNETSHTRLKPLSSHAFEEICQTSIWNYDFRSHQTLENESLGYLIISGDAFYSSLNPFVEWKNANGLAVTMVKLSDIAPGAEDIHVYNYIRHAVYNWRKPPTYVLIVGDVEHVPTHYGIVGVDLERVATDHFYACVCGDDYLPDLFVGRLSVKNITELNAVLDKIISYKGFFNKRVTLIAATYSGNMTDEGSDWVYDFLSAEGYVLDYLYGDFTKSDIADPINEGRAIVNYVGHGYYDKWGGGPFGNRDVLELSNGGKYPIILSFACDTGRYDRPECFGEAWMKASRKGGVAFWGSSRTCEGPLIKELSKGFYRALLNDGLCEFGSITVKAKLWLYNSLGEFIDPSTPYNHAHTHIHFELYNILTDPQLMVTSPQRKPIYIRNDGSVDPPTAGITKTAEATYIFTGNISKPMIIEKSNIKIDGNGYTLQGSGNGTGVTICNVNNVTIQNTNISGFGKGMLLYSTFNNTLSTNKIIGNYFGVWLDYSSKTVISENKITNNEVGIKLTYSGDPYVTIFSPESVSRNNRVFRNKIVSNKVGVKLEGHIRNCLISENEIENNEVGVELDGGDFNNITGNSITANSHYGILVIGGRKNHVFHNNFISNKLHAYCRRYQSALWDCGYPSGGNYWDDYNGTDIYGGTNQKEAGYDLIGDTPYIIDESIEHICNNQDNYPLMNSHPSVHAVAVEDVTSGKTVVGQGFTTEVYVNIINQGHFTETANVTVYANTTHIQTQKISLISGNSTTIEFMWNATPPLGTYMISAGASVEDDVYTSDNVFTDGQITISIKGDINADGKVNILDVATVARAYGTSPVDSKWNANADLDEDGVVNIMDIATVAKEYGKTV